MPTLAQRYEDLTSQLHQTAPKAQLLAVSKGQPVSKIRDLYALGQRAFGENYLDEATRKIAACQDLPELQWHFIGPLQRNKTRPIAAQFDWVHSVDRALLIKRLASQRPDHLPPLQILLQINVDDESQKAGAPASQIPALLQTIGTCPTLQLRGIMGIPENNQNEQGLRASFRALAAAHQQCQTINRSSQDTIDTLSMGMSGDWRIAVQEGATMVRIGTALFGPRD